MNRIRELREARGVSQKELSAQLGVAQPSVCRWEEGRREPPRKYVEWFADYFGVSVDYIYGRDDKLNALPQTTPQTDTKSPEQEQVLTGFKALSKAGKRFVLDMIDSAKRNFPIDTTPLTPDEEEELRLELDKVIEEQDAQKAKRGKRRVHG